MKLPDSRNNRGLNVTIDKSRLTRICFGALAAAALATTVHAAPNCGLVGKWHYNGFLGFGGGQAVVDGILTIKPNGDFTGANCSSWITGQPVDNGCSTGTLEADAKCNISGVIHVPGRDDTIVTGKVRGVIATGVGYRGDEDSPSQVRLITLIKE
jgi:hypothetical protein